MQTNGFRAGATLGDILFGKSDGSAYQDQLGKNYETQGLMHKRDKLMEEAGIARAMNLSRGVVNADLVRRVMSGDLDAQAEMGAATWQAGRTPNMSNFTRGLGDLQEQDFLRKASVAAGLGDMQGTQAMMAGAGDLQKMNDIKGGYQFNPLEVGGDAVALEGELAKIGKTNADAALVDAKRTNPALYRAPPKGAPEPVEPSTAEAILAKIEEKDGKLPPAQRAAMYEGLVTGREFLQKVPTLGEGADAGSRPSEADVLKAISDGRRAIASGRISRAEAKQRLIDAGMPTAAGRL